MRFVQSADDSILGYTLEVEYRGVHERPFICDEAEIAVKLCVHRRARSVPLFLVALLRITHCSGLDAQTPEGDAESGRISTYLKDITDRMDGVESIGYTHVRSDGNRLIDGRGSFPDVTALDIPLQTNPLWLTGVVRGERVTWVVTGDDGSVEAYEIIGRDYRSVPVSPSPFSVGPHLSLATAGGELFVLRTGHAADSPSTHPVVLRGGRMSAAIDWTGNLVIARDSDVLRMDMDALIDGRILVDERDRLLVLTNPTTVYRHGILGDLLEPTEFVVIGTGPVPTVVGRGSVNRQGDVIEGLFPLWVDVNGDGTREIVATVSNAEEGARLTVFSEDGSVFAEGPPIGQGHRWLHQIAVARFGPEGELEIAVVRTPHIGGIVQFYGLAGSRLEVVASRSGYSSHRIGSQNLDMAAAGDFNGDGKIEILVPDQSFTHLALLQRTLTGISELHTIPLAGTLRSNLGLVTTEDARIHVAVGMSQATVRVWISAPKT